MTLLQLSYYIEVCHTKNFTRAAENLHVTQPAITNAVQDLEKEFGLKLIEWDKKNCRSRFILSGRRTVNAIPSF